MMIPALAEKHLLALEWTFFWKIPFKMDALSQALPVLPLLILKRGVFEEKCASLTFVFSFGWVYSDPVFHVCKMSFAASFTAGSSMMKKYVERKPNPS